MSCFAVGVSYRFKEVQTICGQLMWKTRVPRLPRARICGQQANYVLLRERAQFLLHLKGIGVHAEGHSCSASTRYKSAARSHRLGNHFADALCPLLCWKGDYV